ncbi:Regulator of chromosome condensation 1/beta-lactamase-inhibitor protein II [Pseudocohnilembus persalinus]|uniref:Regulator of chromosome condensation 1/beta-lactamase-inhibitor protein II n=1 Tax=Pseudocohnilembus persalinus TaxID=266149 RepID=A0A0V0QK90_PSEPJ|nr:Regulator of chromosome condensation 1/beta-lactamase-inhibitor protein II [Pseudocohnilembus persalinus]|eukprot:KRX02540.1 Regulator of chromosome condensation 1/beta-lactamase-inhibitor protein II [Pseudocohnilembus persalinus]
MDTKIKDQNNCRPETEVYYFGTTKYRPVCKDSERLNDIIQRVNFEKKVVTDIKLYYETDEDSAYNQKLNKQYETYLELMQNIDENKLEFIKVSAKGGSTFLLDNKDELWGFGYGLQGQIGNGRISMNVEKPFNLSRFLNRQFVDVQAGGTHTIGITNKNQLFVWGDASEGYLGQQIKDSYSSVPVKIKKKVIENFFDQDQDDVKLGLGQENIKHTETLYKIRLPSLNLQIKGVSCGKSHCLLWDSDGKIYSWGDGQYGKLGHGSVKGKYKYSLVEPVRIKALEEQKVVTASCGAHHSCCLTYQGEIFTWGLTLYDRSFKKQKEEDIPIDYLRPKKLKAFYRNLSQSQSKRGKNFIVKKSFAAEKFEENLFPTIFTSITSNGNQNAAIDINGFLFTWGENSEYCLGHVISKYYDNPVCLEPLTKKKIIDVSCGDNYTVVIATNQKNPLAFHHLKEMNRKICDNAISQANKIKQFCELKMIKEKQIQALKNNQNLNMSSSGSVHNSLYSSQIQNLNNSNQKYGMDQVQVPLQARQQSQNILNGIRNKKINKEALSFNKPTLQSQQNIDKQKFEIPKLNIKNFNANSELGKSILENQNTERKIKQSLRQHKMNQDKILGIRQHPEIATSQRKQLFMQGVKSDRPKTANLQRYNQSHTEHKVKAPFFKYDDDKIILDSVIDRVNTHNINDSFELISINSNDSMDGNARMILEEVQRKRIEKEKEEAEKEKLKHMTQQEIRRQRVTKGVYTKEVFEHEIKEIYNEYRESNKQSTKQQRIMQTLRGQGDPFIKSRQKFTKDIRDKFYDTQEDFKTQRSFMSFSRNQDPEYQRGLQTLNNFFEESKRTIQQNTLTQLNQKSLMEIEPSKIMKTIPKSDQPTVDFFSKKRNQFNQSGAKQRLSPWQRIIFRMMIRSWIVWKKTQIVIRHFLMEKIKRKIYLATYQYRIKIIKSQNLLKWFHQQYSHQKKLITIMWDSHLLSVSYLDNQGDTKQIENYKEKLNNINRKYGVVKNYNNNNNNQVQKVGEALQDHFDQFVTYVQKQKLFIVGFGGNKKQANSAVGIAESNKDLLKIIYHKASENNFKISGLLEKLNLMPVENLKIEKIDCSKIEEEKSQQVSRKPSIPVDNLENDQQKQKSNQGEQTDDDQQELKKMAYLSKKKKSSILPYSLNADVIRLPIAYRYPNEKLRKNENARKQAANIECQVKDYIIQKILKKSRQKYNQEMNEFQRAQNIFMKEKSDLINQKRAELIHLIPIEVLRTVMKKEEEERKFKPDLPRDHLPFFDMRYKIAENIPGAPQKPQFSLHFPLEQMAEDNGEDSELPPEFTDQEKKIIEKWYEQNDNLKDFLIEGQDSDLKFTDFNKKEQEYINLFNKQSEQFKEFVKNMEEDIDEGDFGEFDSAEINFIERWNQQEDLVREQLISGTIDKSKLNDQQKKFVDEFESQPEKVKDYLLQEDEGVEFTDEETEFIKRWNDADDKVVDYLTEGPEEGKKYSWTKEQQKLIDDFEKLRPEVKDYLIGDDEEGDFYGEEDDEGEDAEAEPEDDDDANADAA